MGWVTSAYAQDARAMYTDRDKLLVCADPYIYPYSSANHDPPGFDIEVVREVGKRLGVEVEYDWVDTGTRGGLGKALRNSIGKGKCLIFTGLAVNDDEAGELAEKHAVFTAPYMSGTYTLVTVGKHMDAQSLDDLKDVKVGVAMSTPPDAYLFDNKYDRGLYNGDRRVLEGLAKGEIEAGLIWFTTITQGRKDHPDVDFKVVSGFKPIEGMKWNMAFAIADDMPELKAKVDKILTDMVASGDVKRIVESYGVPYFPPSGE